MRDYTNPEDTRQELHEQINDNSIERGIPTELNVKKKSTMTKVLFLVAGLVVAGIAISGIMSYFGGEDEEAPKKQEEMIGNTQQKNFKAEQDEIGLEIPSAAASEPDLAASATVNEAGASGSEFKQEMAVERQVAEPPLDERLNADVMVDVGDRATAVMGAGERSNAEEGSAGLGVSPQSSEAGRDNGGSRLASMLNSGVYRATAAQNRGDTTYLLARGTGISCTTTTKIVTTYPGLTRCQVDKDVYSANGKTLLVERGSTVLGEQNSALTQGQARIFAIWSELETTSGVKVQLDSPGGDSLGASGHPAHVNNHFWKRIGGAVMISMIDDVIGAYSRRSNNSNVTFESTTESAQDIASQILQNTINIAPTGYVNQGTQIMIYVARDVDFSHVYENVQVPYH